MPIITKPIDEGKEVKGQKFTDYTDHIKYDDKGQYAGVSGSKDDDFETMGTTAIGKGGVLDVVAQNKIERIDLEKEKAIAESADILKEYVAYVGGKLNEAILNYGSKDNTNIEDRMRENIIAMTELGFSEQEIDRTLNGEYTGLKIVDTLCDKYGAKDYDPLNNPDDPNVDPKIRKEIREKTNKAIQNILKLRINYVNKITTLMSEMIKVNYKTLGLSEQQMQEYLKALQSGTNDSVKAAGELKEVIKKNSDKYAINNGEGYDLRPLGFGCIFGPSEGYVLNFAKADTDQESMLNLIQSAMRYDAVVVAHGGSNYKSASYEIIGSVVQKIYNDSYDKINNRITHDYTQKLLYSLVNSYVKDKYKDANKDFGDQNLPWQQDYIKSIKDIITQSKYNKDEITKVCNRILNSGYITPKDLKSYISTMKDDFHNNKNYDMLMNGDDSVYELFIHSRILSDLRMTFVTGSNYWHCQPTKTLQAGPFDEVNELVRQLIKEGFKKIMIKDCNPGGHKLADDIMNTKGILINYSDFSNYVESVDLSDDPNIHYINEVEQELRDLCEEYGFDYDDNEYINECYSWYMSNQDIINEEGLGSKLWEFFKKCVAAIIGFIKRIFNFVKLALTKVKELFLGGESNSEKAKQAKITIEKPIKTPMLSAKDKKVIEIEASSNAELEKKGNEVISEMMSITKEVKDKADKGNKEIEKMIKSMEKTSEVIKKESFSMIRSLLEFDAGDGTNQDDDTQVDIEDPDDTSTPTPEEPANDPAPTQDDDPAGATDIDMDDPDAGTTEPTPEPANEPAPAAEPSIDDPAGATDIDMDDPDATPDAGSDAGEGEYTLDDGDDDPAGDTDIDMDDPDTTGGEGDPESGEEPGEGGDDDPAGATDIDMDDPDSEGGEGDGTADGIDSSNPDSSDSQDQMSGLKAIENELFENLTDKQKQIKIKELKNNYVELFDRCDGIIDIINSRKPSDESTAQIFDYINNVILDLQNTVHDYLEHTFSTKSYLENDAQFKSYLNILNTINNILKELNIDKK